MKKINIIILAVLFFGVINSTFAHVPITLTASMITDESGQNTSDVLVDNSNTTWWLPGWNSNLYPAGAVIDLGEDYNLTQIALYDYSGSGSFKIFTGSPGNWSSSAVINDPLNNYGVMNSHFITANTRYLRLEMSSANARVGTILVYGTPDGGGGIPAPSINPIGDTNMDEGQAANVGLSAQDATSLSISGLPSFGNFTNSGNGNGLLTFNPSTGDAGSYGIGITATGPGGSSTSSFTLTVNSTSGNGGGNGGGGTTEVLCQIASSQMLFGGGDVANLFDEQVISGDPRTGPGGAPTQRWSAGWNSANVPAAGYIDLGGNYEITRIYVRDIHGQASIPFKAYSGTSPANWNLSTPLFSDNLGGWQVWNEHPVSVTTRYIRFEMSQLYAYAAEVLVYGYCGGGGGPTGDTTAPSTVMNLSTSSPTQSSIVLNWTSPGDDLNIGMAASYDLRKSSNPINASNFANATVIEGVSSPKTAGTSETHTVTGLNCSTNNYFAIKAIDEANNIGDISNIANSSTANCNTGGGSSITLTVNYNGSPSGSPSANKTALRFDKDFAYSLTIDDGGPWEYYNVLPILKGGSNSHFYNGGTSWTVDQYESGFTYPDGFGGNRAYKAGLSINAWHILSSESGSYMSWAQIQALYNADWDIFNHSWKHCAYGCNYYTEVTNGASVIQSNIGFTPTHFMVPSGDYNGYKSTVFANGNVSMHDQKYFMPGNGGLDVDGTVNLNQFEMHRNTLETEATPYGSDITSIANQSVNGNHLWFHEYSHRVGSPGEPYAVVLKNDFRAYMNYIKNNYNNRVWMAPAQEVYEYLAVRQSAIVSSSSVSGNTQTITIDISGVPSNLRRKALTLKLNTNTSVNSVSLTGGSATLKSNSQGLIDIEF